MKVQLRKETKTGARSYWDHIRQWSRSVPFCVNWRGILVHRIRSGRTHIDEVDGSVRHHTVTYWCANGGGGRFCEFVAEPPSNRLVCARCEAMAVAAGQPSLDELCGRHVHIGSLKANRHCCRNDDN